MNKRSEIKGSYFLFFTRKDTQVQKVFKKSGSEKG